MSIAFGIDTWEGVSRAVEVLKKCVVGVMWRLGLGGIIEVERGLAEGIMGLAEVSQGMTVVECMWVSEVINKRLVVDISAYEGHVNGLVLLEKVLVREYITIKNIVLKVIFPMENT